MNGQHHYSVSVAAAIVNSSGSVLAIKRRDNGHWEPPGGILEPDETVHEGVLREVLEETGLTVEIEELTGVYQNIARGVISLVFRCRAISGQPRPTYESTAVAWLKPTELTERMDEAYAIRVLDGINTTRPNTPVRAHDGVRLLTAADA